MERLKYLRACAATGPFFLFIFIVFWGVMSSNIPPLAADLPANLIADYFVLFKRRKGKNFILSKN